MNKVKKSRRINVQSVQNAWQKEGWLPDTMEHGLIEAVVRSDTPKSGKIWALDAVCSLPN